MKLLRFALALLAATILHAVGSRLFVGFPAAVDLFLVLAVYNSLMTTVAWGSIGGSVAGLVRDGLSGGLYGLHGFADTLVAFLAVRIQQRLVIQKPLQVGLLLAVAAAVQLALVAGLQFLLVPGSEVPSSWTIFFRMASSGLLGALIFVLAGRSRTALEGWRERRRKRLGMAI